MPTETLPKSSPRKWPLIVGLVLTALLQVAIILQSPAIGKDGPTFIQMAKDMESDFAGTVQAADQHPGYPLLILLGKGVFAMIGMTGASVWVLGALLFPWLCGILVVWQVWLLVRCVFSDREANLAVFMAAVLPLLRRNASDAMSDIPCLALYLAALLLLVAGLRRKQPLLFLGVGCASAMGYWIRPEGLSVAIVAGVMLTVGLLWREKRVRTLICLLCLVLSTCAVAVPYMVIKGSVTAKTRVLSPESHVAQTPPPASASERLKTIVDGGGAMAKRKANTLPLYLKPFLMLWEIVQRVFEDGLRYFLIVPLALGLFWPGRKWGEKIAARTVAALAGFHLLLLVALFMTKGYVNSRHIIVFAVLCMPWIGRGITILGKVIEAYLKLRQWRLPRFAANRVAALIVIILCAILIPSSAKGIHGNRTPFVRAAEWIAMNSMPSDHILSITGGGYIKLYAGLDGDRIIFPRDISDEILDRVELQEYAYIVVDARHFPAENPLLIHVGKYYEDCHVLELNERKSRARVLIPKKKPLP
jgi:4-amino-4-deoxy-L-arabinose transferase-like glycosyltransferase